MIRFLEHKEIDYTKWDHCISHAVNFRVSAMSWYLNIVAPGWNALVEDEYVSVFPLTCHRKYGINYLFQPFFAQQLGIFSNQLLSENLVNNFLDAIPPKFRLAEINLNSLNKVDPLRHPVSFRVNHELDLIHPYEKLISGYNQNTRRNLKKATEGKLVIQRKVDPNELITLFIRNFGGKEGKLRFSNYETLRELINYCLLHTFGKIIGVHDQDDKLCAGVFLLFTKDRIIFHFAASNSAARENGAMFLLVDNIIRENAGKPVIFDFEGSNDPNVARFYQGFGAKESLYPHVVLNRMPWILRIAVNFAKKFH